MTQPELPYLRRVGSVRPSHLMFTAGIGGLVDLPNFSVLIRGLDDWSYQLTPTQAPIFEPRLLAAVRHTLEAPGVKELRSAPWLPGADDDPKGPATRVGVPVTPFPQWLRCTRCNTLAGLDSHTFRFDNLKARRPDEAFFYHPDCGRKRRLAVPARFLLACVNGHLDDFPYVHFVHQGGDCVKATHPTLKMVDHGGNLGANVTIECTNCGEKRNIRQAMGVQGALNLPACRGRHPHLATFETCDQPPKLLVLGASNQWFADTLTVLYVPPTGASALQAKVAEVWDLLQAVTSKDILIFALTQPQYRALNGWDVDTVWAAIEDKRVQASGQADPFDRQRPDVLTAEWEAFTSKPGPPPMPDFALRDDAGVPTSLRGLLGDVVQAERLREVRALVGFTRLDAPDPEDPNLVIRAPIGRAKAPDWVPASEVRGEGLFLRIRGDVLTEWEERVAPSAELEAHRLAYGRFRSNRYSDRIQGNFDEFKHWPGPRYIALHTLSHLLIRAISLECGYSSASLSERIYAGSDDNPRGGILIYTAVPDAEGTLGGLVSLGEPETLQRLVSRALRDAMRCSSDPLCAERLPAAPADFLHGAACHVCLFVSETTCERGNRFLDRRFVVPVAGEKLALVQEAELTW